MMRLLPSTSGPAEHGDTRLAIDLFYTSHRHATLPLNVATPERIIRTNAAEHYLATQRR